MQYRCRNREHLAFSCLLLFGLLSFWQLSSKHNTALLKELTLKSLDFNFHHNSSRFDTPDNTSVVEIELLIKTVQLEHESSSTNKQELTQRLFSKMISENFNASSDAEAPPASYRILHSSLLTEAAKTEHFQRQEEKERYRSLILLLNQKAEVGGGARLYVIPVDPLAWMKEAKSANYETMVQQFADYLNRGRPYIRFKGSDHVFLCLSKSCQSFGEDFARRLTGNMGSRAIFASPYNDAEQLEWPCPLRVLHLEESALSYLDVTTEAVLKAASVMIERRNRWTCSNATQMENHFGDHSDTMGFGGIYMEKYKFLLCQIPHNEDSALMTVLRRLMEEQEWRSTQDGLPLDPANPGITNLSNSDDMSLIQAIYEDPDITKAAIVRHPIPRLLSAYLEKIIALRDYSSVEKLTDYVEKSGVPSFSEFVDFLIRIHPDPTTLDQDFLLQSQSCGLRDHKFDFVGSLSDLGSEFEELLKSLGFGGVHIASAKGKDSNRPFGVQLLPSELLWEYYSEDLMRKVYNYYKEDFERFGFTVEEMLATKPRQ